MYANGSTFRLNAQGMKVIRYPQSVARYTMVVHGHDKGNPISMRMCVSQFGNRRIRTDSEVTFESYRN